MMELEICVESVESAIAADEGGAQRVELCSALSEGGLTPSLGMLRAVREAVKLGVYVMIRPRGGDFLYSEAEYAIMLDDIRRMADCGADGVVLGLLTAQGELDVERTARLVEAAGPMGVTVHRAVDMSRDLNAAMEGAIQAGAHRILTSGAAATALEGGTCIASLVKQAAGRIGIMVGGNVRPWNLAQVVTGTGASQFHTALRTKEQSPMEFRNAALSLGDTDGNEYARYRVLTEDVRRLRAAMDAIA
ncbi:MAG TPA: copper homeostasis protein CutC [Acidobacteriaceae bacterium]|jgi:copper homeostasis protein|nr:copper homeostasis protein CutC [Acidobacteriaceae bacterium]